MKRVSTKSVSVVSGKKVFIGIDVHKDSWHVTARTDGEEVFNGRIPASYHSLMKLLERFRDCQIRVAYEAGPCDNRIDRIQRCVNCLNANAMEYSTKSSQF